MVLKSASVLACLLPARLGLGSTHSTHEDDDPVDARSRANTVPSYGDIGESPNPAHRPGSPPGRHKRSSLTTFFAFSSRKKPSVIHLPQFQRDLFSPQSVPGRWLPGSAQTEVHLINHSTVPSPLRTDEEDYYYSYYSSPPPSTSLHPDTAQSRRRSLRQQDLIGNPHLPSADTHPSQTQIQHPFAYSTPLCSRPHSNSVGAAPSLRHATSQTFQPPSDLSPTLVYSRATSSHIGHQTSQSHPAQPKLKTSISTPNLAAGASPGRPRSLSKKKPPTRSKGQERLLSAETWWDALLSPSPRFKVRQALRPHTATGTDAASGPGQSAPSRTLGIAFPSVPAARPRAVSATTNVRPSVPTLARSRSATDLDQPSTSAVLRTGFEPALETLVDEPALAPDKATGRDTELSSLEPPPSLAQVLDEGQAFEEQRAQWKRQATHSIGNKRTRSFSRARSKSLSEKHVRGHGASESAKVHFNLEFLAARSLLGSQSTMPTVHVVRPSSSSGHSKAYSHSHSGHSHTHSRTYSHSHSHSHSLTTSHSSKSSRNPRGHSRSGSWGRTAFLKAGALCGITQAESYGAAVDEKVPPSSRVDLQGVIHISAAPHAAKTSDAAQTSPSPDVPTDEVGIAISPTPPTEGPSGPTVPGPSHVPSYRHEQDDRESRWSSMRSHKSSEYAGPHPSAVDSQLPQLAAASTVSLRHRLPPRATVYPPISPILHPYRTVYDQAGKSATPKIPVAHATTESRVERPAYPHISLSHADFEQYGVGEALVYASFPSPSGVSEIKQPDVDNNSSCKAKRSLPEEQSSSFGTLVSQREGSDTASMAINTPPSLTNSTIQMVMSAFNNPDDLDEFQDLFYKPHPISGSHRRESITTINQLPIDVRSSASSSPLTHLVRKLSEEVHGSKDSPRMPSEPMYLQRSESQGQPSSESVTKIVFMGLARSSSPPPMESSLQLQGGEESTTQPMMVVPEDVESSYTASMLESPPLVHENDTFGRPIRHGQLEAVTAPSPTRTSVRVSTHLSIQEAESDVDESTFLSPPPQRYGLSVADAVRSSCVTTSDVSQMSGIFDFPLPPSTRPGEEPAHASVLHSYFEPTPSVSESRSESRLEDSEMEQDWHTDSEYGELPGDVGDTVHALRASRVARYESRRTFGENDDEDFMTQLQQARHGRESPSL